MRLKLFVAATVFVAAPIVALAQKDDHPATQASKPTIEEVQKLVQTISNDKTKLQAYCELGKLQDQMQKAED